MNLRKRNNHDEIIPLKFHLSQNYPNPFKEKTKIKYCIAYKTDVQLTVYNSEGRIEKELIRQNQEAGTYEIEFNAKNFSNGIYLCKIKADDYVCTKKMILLK